MMMRVVVMVMAMWAAGVRAGSPSAALNGLDNGEISALVGLDEAQVEALFPTLFLPQYNLSAQTMEAFSDWGKKSNADAAQGYTSLQAELISTFPCLAPEGAFASFQATCLIIYDEYLTKMGIDPSSPLWSNTNQTYYRSLFLGLQAAFILSTPNDGGLVLKLNQFSAFDPEELFGFKGYKPRANTGAPSADRRELKGKPPTAPTTPKPTKAKPTKKGKTTPKPTTASPTTQSPTLKPTMRPTTAKPRTGTAKPKAGVLSSLSPVKQSAGGVEAGNPSDIPDAYDMRNPLWPVKNQGQCGSCWTFAAVAALEGAFAKLGGPVTTTFSEQEFVDCVLNTDDCCSGCSGGDAEYAWEYLATSPKGITTEIEYPYQAVQGTCQSSLPGVLKTEATDTYLSLSTVTDIQTALLNNGPVTIVISGGSSCFQSYSSGIITNTCGCDGPLDHQVAIVGWGVGYWIVRNSWGSGWGMDGYAYFDMENSGSSGICGMMNQVSVPRGIITNTGIPTGSTTSSPTVTGITNSPTINNVVTKSPTLICTESEYLCGGNCYSNDVSNCCCDDNLYVCCPDNYLCCGAHDTICCPEGSECCGEFGNECCAPPTPAPTGCPEGSKWCGIGCIPHDQECCDYDTGTFCQENNFCCQVYGYESRDYSCCPDHTYCCGEDGSSCCPFEY